MGSAAVDSASVSMDSSISNKGAFVPNSDRVLGLRVASVKPATCIPYYGVVCWQLP